MNGKQQVALWAGITLLVVMSLFPPWAEIVNLEGRRIERPAGYTSIFEPPQPTSESEAWRRWTSMRIDFSRLLIQWVIVTVVTGGAIITLRDRDGGT
jgi:hypothetical protein